MKFIIVTVFVIFFVQGAIAQDSPADVLAHRIASKMRDSLQLSAGARDTIYQINIQLYEKKKNARKNITDPGGLKNAIQQIENTRDSLYRNILSEDKFLLYRQKKVKLVSGQ